MAQTQPRGLMPQSLAEYLFYQGYRYIETNRDSGAIVAYNGSELIRAVAFKTVLIALCTKRIISVVCRIGQK